MSAPWVTEIEIPEQLARRLLDEQFPEFRDCPLTLLGEGWDNVAWQVGDGWVFRFPRRQVAADLITAENAVMPGVAEHLTAPVAWPQRVGQPTDDYQWPFAGYSLIKGEELCMAAPPAGRRLLLAEELGKFLRSLHAVSAEEASKLGAPLDTIRRLDIKYRSRRTIEYLARAVDLGLIENLRPWELLLEHVIPLCRQPRSVCLVHGDLYSRHVIVKSADNGGDQDARLADVIDWGDLHVGEPAIDLSCAWSLLLTPQDDNCCWIATATSIQGRWHWRDFEPLPIPRSVSFTVATLEPSSLSRPARMRCSGCLKTDFEWLDEHRRPGPPPLFILKREKCSRPDHALTEFKTRLLEGLKAIRHSSRPSLEAARGDTGIVRRLIVGQWPVQPAGLGFPAVRLSVRYLNRSASPSLRMQRPQKDGR